MGPLLVGNGPCSWGTLEFEQTKAEPIGFSRMLDELVETGYTGTELGDWGYLPTDPTVLRLELTKRGLAMLGAFVSVALNDPRAHEAGMAAIKTARLLAAVAADAHFGVEREFAQEVHLHLLGGAASATVAEDVDPLVAVRYATKRDFVQSSTIIALVTWSGRMKLPGSWN